jgi:putative endopeptidase
MIRGVPILFHVRAALLASAALWVSACDNPRAASAEAGAAASAARAADDFYAHVNREWIDSFELSPEKSYDSVFEEIRRQVHADISAILQDISAANPAPGTTEAKVADLYTSWMDEAAIEAHGLDAMRPRLQRISAVRSARDFVRVISDPLEIRPFNFSIGALPDDANRHAVTFSQGGLGIGRSYYTMLGERNDEVRKAYIKLIETLLRLAGDSDPAGAAQRVFTLERKIGATHWRGSRNRDVLQRANVMDRAALKKLSPEID